MGHNGGIGHYGHIRHSGGIGYEMTAYSPAVDARGRADCRVGQTGYLAGPNVPNGRYPPSTDPTLGGGSHVVRGFDGIPGHVRHGGTYKSRELGIDSIEDVP